MAAAFRFVTPEHQCSYLPEQLATLEYLYYPTWSAAGYEKRMAQGWRRFGHSTFHPICAACHKCQPIRVVVDHFSPTRSQRRAWQANDGIVTLRVGQPSVSEAKLDLHYRFHAFQSGFKDWPTAQRRDAVEYHESFVANPFPTEEWCYYRGDDLIGVGYVDVLPASLSAIYFFYEPDLRGQSLGTYNVLSVIARARQRRLPHVYLGFYVAGCRSMEYKATFRPNEVLGPDGHWRTFKT
jgi:arginine-tRNA-protein transferase